MKTTSTRTLKRLTAIGAVLYLLFMLMLVFYDSYPIFNPFGLVEGQLIVFIAGLVLVWRNKKIVAAIVFMIWNAAIWFGELYLIRSEEDTGMASAVASYFMLIGALFLLDWYKSSKATVPSPQQEWKFLLRVLLINYAVLYFIVVFSEVSVGAQIDYFSFPFVLYPSFLLIFAVGFLLSWKKELIGGYVFLFWFAVLVTANIVFFETLQMDGWALFGLPILLQGIFYIKNHYEFKSK